MDQRLFLPEAWFSESYGVRRHKCQMPDELTFQSKPQVAAAMLKGIVAQGRVPFRYIVADCLYGNSPEFLDALDACVGVTTLVAIPGESRCWRQRPQRADKTYRYKGQERSKRVRVGADQAPMTVAALAASLPASSWYRRRVSEGTKGPIEYELARQRVTLSKGGLPDRTVWLVMKRTFGAEPRYAYAISNAPRRTPLSTFVWLSGRRGAIEQCFEECKGEVGMDHYEVRQYGRWHHHMLMTMLAHFFLWRLKLALGKKSTRTDGVAATEVA